MSEIQVWHAPKQKVLIPKPENPAKKLLSRYRSMIRERDALQDEINASFGKATSCTTQLSPIKTGGSAAYDRMGENTINMIDAQERLEQSRQQLNLLVQRIMKYWDAMEDERQKELILYKYIRGMKWEDIQEKMSYERTQIYVLHGRALLTINRMMQAD